MKTAQLFAIFSLKTVTTFREETFFLNLNKGYVYMSFQQDLQLLDCVRTVVFKQFLEIWKSQLIIL